MCAALKQNMAALRADHDAYAGRAVKDREDSRQELERKQQDMASIKESSTKHHFESRSLDVRLDAAKI